jgi:hypothetical protein
VRFSCLLLNNTYINQFARDVLWIAVEKYLECGILSTEKLANHMSESYRSLDGVTLNRPGLTKNESVKVVKWVKKGDRESYENALNDPKKFHKIIGSIYSFTERRNEVNQRFVVCMIEKDKKLKRMILKRIVDLFCLPPKFTWEELKKSVNNHPKNMDLFYSALIDMTSCPKSTIRRNLSKSYIRSSSTQTYVIPKNDISNQCHKSVTRNSRAKVVLASSYYDVNDTFFENVLKKYKRNVLAGPSGSILVTSDFIFKVLGMPNTEKNRMLLLGAAIADYIPFHHTLTEILISYSKELNLGYTLDKDPIEFTLNKLRAYM